MDSDTTRLNKYIALHLGISRRAADEYIEKKRVKINDALAELGARVGEGDTVSIDGTPLSSTTAFTYVLFHKPVGYVCSRKQQGDNPTIYDLIPKKYHHLKPVGRLDKDSSGLILLTNDGDFAHHMTHPSFHKVKVYEAEITPALEPLHQQMINDHGITLEDGTSKLTLERLDDERTQWRITMHEGRNRQIRRTFGALGYDVTHLHRIQFGSFNLEQLAPGKIKEIELKATE